MLLTREEMTFDFRGAQLDPVRDRQMLGWMFNQFLYGEVTGIQCGHWMYNAPDLDAARFLAKQSLEEFQHIDNFLLCLAYLDEAPAAPNSIVRFLSTGMMPEAWSEHVAIEMAQGEGFVLMGFYALIDTIAHKGIVDVLTRAVKQEERHVDFGEQRTIALTRDDPALRRRLLGVSLVSIWSVVRLARYMERTLDKNHPVLRQLPRFLDAVVHTGELRLQRMGLLGGSLSSLSRAKKALLVAEAYAHKAVSSALRYPRRFAPFAAEPTRLTDRYLDDVTVHAALERARQRAAGNTSLASQ